MKRKLLWRLSAVVILGSVVLGACAVARPGARGSDLAVETAPVTVLTAVEAVETSGAVAARQSATLSWKTTGYVETVNVKVGDRVKAGDVLMRLDIDTAPQNIIQAQADLINAQNALDELLNPTELQIANAEKAVADAQDQVEKAERAWRRTAAPDVAYYQDQFNRAQQNLTAAQQNAEITNFQTSLRNAQDALENAANNLKKYQDLEAQYPGYGQQHGNVLENAQKAYDRAVQDYQTALYNFEQVQARNANAITDAQKSLDTARANLEAAQRGPDALDRARAEADLAVARARLAEAQATLDELRHGADPDDVRAAEVRVQVAQAVLDQLVLVAPFDGEVLVVNYQPGDAVVQGQPAVVVADRATLQVEAQVDESEIGQVTPGDEVTLTFGALPGVTLAGTVGLVNPVGEAVQGLVRYTVRVDVAAEAADPRVLLGMTADVSIITDRQAGALAVPLDAVQLDDQGEYVTRLTRNADGTPRRERVAVTSGLIQDQRVVVRGALTEGDTVLIASAEAAQAAGGFPFGGMGAGRQP